MECPQGQNFPVYLYTDTKQAWNLYSRKLYSRSDLLVSLYPEQNNKRHGLFSVQDSKEWWRTVGNQRAVNLKNTVCPKTYTGSWQESLIKH